MNKILVIQTSFIGDVILATAVLEQLHRHFPKAEIDFLLRKGNESLFTGHPFLHETLIWDKKKNKKKNLFRLLFKIRKTKYDLVVNLQRFLSTGILTAFSGAKNTTGFDKNPLSFLFSKRVKHFFGTKDKPVHEVERNLSLISEYTDNQFVKPKLYPSEKDFSDVYLADKYICMAPTSVWPTKQLPRKKWVELMDRVGERTTILLLGAPGDFEACEALKKATMHPTVQNLAGKMTLLQSAAKMKGASMNYVNDSAPLHLASAVDAPVTAFFCSTLPAFGFGPLSSKSIILETTENLACRPCGLHGKKACPERHFRCGEIVVSQLERT